MGLFSRNESAPASGRRSSLSSEAQVNELRGRARRRLIGALVLVLAAVIIVPMLFDSNEPVEQAAGPLVVPAIVTPGEPSVALAPSSGTGSAGTIDRTPQTPEPADPVMPPSTDIAGTEAVTPPDPAPAPETPVAPPPKPEPKPVKKEEPKPKESKPAVERTDDGSVAIALLEGRTPKRPATPAASGSGNFILQIAAYTSDKDAQVRRDRLVSAGVTNTYVESATAGGKPTYRLRVGPFPTRDAAQAAQARLRALGYDNGFISTK